MEQRDFEAAQAIVLSTYKFQKWQLLDNLDFFVYRDIMTIRIFLGGITTMEIIERAFYRAYSKRSKSILVLLMPVILMAAAQVAMFVAADMLLGFFTVICIVVLLIARRILLSRKSYVRKKISNALHKETQSDLFFSSIEAEMRSPNLQTYTVDRKQISIFVTKNWLILASPNGCLISMLRDIKNISVVFKETKSRFRLKVDFFSGSSFSCKYECLYEPLVELINKSKGVVS